MARYIQIKLVKRNVSCTAQLLDDLAPRTCEAVWQALPLGDAAFHAKYASNEVYTLVPPFAPEEPGLENPTLTPIPGDLLYFFFPPGIITRPDVLDTASRQGMVDMAIFYGRDNLLFSPTVGPTPGSRFGMVTENLEEMAQACDHVWREGFAGEKLVFSRAE